MRTSLSIWWDVNYTVCYGDCTYHANQEPYPSTSSYLSVYHPQILPDFQGQSLRTYSRDLNWLSGLYYCYCFETFLVIHSCHWCETFEGVELPAVRLLRCTSNPLAIVSGLTNIEQVLAAWTKTTERNGGKIPETRRWIVCWSWLRARIENNQMWIIYLYLYFLLVLMFTVFLRIIIQ